MAENSLPLRFGRAPYGAIPSIVVVVAIDTDAGGKAHAIGTAFPVLCDGIVALVTASHVAEKLKTRHGMLVNESRKVLVDDARVLGNSKLDIAFIHLNSDDLYVLFGEQCLCVETDERVLDCNDSGLSALYQVFGYPVSKNKISYAAIYHPHAFRMSLGESSTAIPATGIAEVDVPLLCFKASPSELIDNDGQRSSVLGAFNGLSGGPVVKYPLSDNGASLNCLPGAVVGVFVEWHKREGIAVVIPMLAVMTCLRNWARKFGDTSSVLLGAE